MYTIQLLFILLAASNIFSSRLTVKDIFPEKLIKLADEVPHHPDFGLDIVQYLQKYGYPIESHEVTTEDGYILTMHRIPHGRDDSPVPGDRKRPAILVMHGLLSSSMDLVNMGPGKSIGLLLADHGYDVWLGNNRGNTWSRKHVSLDPDTDKEFWDFSFDDCGYYDLPAKIDYILSTTGQEKISYIGHSQGTSQFFAMASLRPEYNDKITIMLAFAPVAYMQDMVQPIMPLLSEYWTTLEVLAALLDIHEIFPHSEFFADAAKVACNNESPIQELCADILFLMGGIDSDQLDRSLIEVIFSNVPSGASLRMIAHYLQEYESGLFRRYDYGPIKNLEVYRQFIPPSYPVSSITAPVILFYAQNDYMSAVVDVEHLAAELPNVVHTHLIDYELFTHLDYIWAKDIDTLLNNHAVQLVNMFNGM